MPSIAAIIMAENPRYGLDEASGHRNSIRFAFGEVKYIGSRIAALRLRRE